MSRALHTLRPHRIVIATLLGLLLLVGCGGGGGGGGTASLTVEVVGLPAGVDGDVRVSGGGVSRTVTETRTLALPPGTYGLEARPVQRTQAAIVPGETYAATLTSSQVSLSGTASVRASYRATSEVVLLVPSYHVRSDIASVRLLSIQDLAVTGAPSRSAFVGDKQLTAAAVEPRPTGRVFLSNEGASSIRVAIVNDDGLSIVASFSGSDASTANVLALAFTPNGDLWVLSAVDTPSLHRFAASDLDGASGSGLVLTPNASVALPSAEPPQPVRDRPDIVTLVVDDDDRLWVVDERGDRILRFAGASTPGGPTGPTVFGSISQPTSAAFDAGNRLYVATTHGVRRYTDATSLSTYDILQLGIANQDRPETLVFDGSGALWVGTQAGELLRVRNPAGTPSVEPRRSWLLTSDTSAPAFGGNAIFVPPLDR